MMYFSEVMSRVISCYFHFDQFRLSDHLEGGYEETSHLHHGPHLHFSRLCQFMDGLSASLCHDKATCANHECEPSG